MNLETVQMFSVRTKASMPAHFLRTDGGRSKSALRKHRWLGWLLAALIVAVIAGQVTHNTDSDPRGTLLVSQALVQHGSLKLDAYGETLLNSYGYVIHQKGGHFYNYFPLGTALVSTPFVAIANAFGFDMIKDEPFIQMLLATLAALLITFILYKTARLYLRQTESLLLAGLCWFGSSLASTVGTALWSHDFALVFSSAAIFLVLRRRQPETLLAPALIGLSLFLAYLCRPTLALLAPFLLLYYFLQDKKSAVLAGVTLSLLLLGFIGWSLHEFGQILPDYYLPKRLEGGDFKTALYGNLLSPARGLLIFSPFLLISLLLTIGLAPRNKGLAKLGLISLAWPLAHLLSVSQFPHWWAGWSFGARLMVDALPGLFVGLFAGLAALGHKRNLAYAAVAVSGLFAIYINTYQALFNPYGMQWNVEPNVDQYPEYLFDWRYPQFLHSKNRHEKRLSEFRSHQLPSFTGLIDISYDSAQAAFDSFYGLEAGFRWSEGQDAKLSLMLGEQNLSGEANLQAGFLGNQALTITLNGQQIYAGHFEGGDREIRFSFAPELLHVGLNTFTFHLPNAHKPASDDPRVLAMAFRKFSLR
ncbi:MAG: glycosyltransferase family 39 protein [Pseudomonadaceae bacterium]|nr:glycosyltransferase family 39 protein [Pseudomonadaceae bacterium]